MRRQKVAKLQDQVVAVLVLGAPSQEDGVSREVGPPSG